MSSPKPWYAASSPDLSQSFHNFLGTVTEENSLDTKTMELIKVAVSSVFRCQHCTEDHIEKALKAGATKREIADALLLASLQAAGTQLYWAKDMFEQHLGES